MCAVELFIQMGSITETQHLFHCEMNWLEAPFPNAIHQWDEEGSVTCKKATSSAVLSSHTQEHYLNVGGHWLQSEAIWK